MKALQQNDTGYYLRSAKKVKNCETAVHAHKKIQRLYIGLRENKTFESRSITLDSVIWGFNYYSGRSKAINVLPMVLHFCFYIPLKKLRNYAFSSAGNDAINTIPQLCTGNHTISPSFFASCFLCIHSLQ